MFKKKLDETHQEMTFTAYIIKGNRQVIRREVVASKRFRVDDETYIIKPECIFLKYVDDVLRSVSYYREGNPNPYDFKSLCNDGLHHKELDSLFAEDFFFIMTDIEPESKMKYILWVSMVNLALVIMFAVTAVIKIFI